ncbi:MAG TPA: hypothetical protein VFB81_15530, partial [Myxococcales bacterium]|nr:hypothetical protein [Myxococcales bacterium]
MPSHARDELIETAITFRDLASGHRQPYLAVHDSPVPAEFGTYFVLLSRQVVVGRDRECMVRLLADSVSARHAMLTVLEADGPAPRAQLENLSQKANRKTEVEGGDGHLHALKPGEKAILQAGEKVHLGEATIRFDVFVDLSTRLRQQLRHAVALMREGKHLEAMSGLAAVGRYRAAGGSGTTDLERTLAAARYYEARIDAAQGRWSRAMGLLDELLELPWLQGDAWVKALFHRGMIAISRNDLDEGHRLARQALVAAKSAGAYPLAMAGCLHGMVEARQRRFASAAESFRDATRALGGVLPRDGARDGGTLSKRLLLEQAVASFLNEEHDLALDQLQRVLQVIGEEPSARMIRGEALRYAGIIRSLRRDFSGAHADLSEALRAFQAVQNRYLECKAHKSLGLNYLSWGRLDEAEFHFKQCTELANEVENPYERSVVAAHLGKVLLSRGEPAGALEW